jgi:hypothetical protein
MGSSDSDDVQSIDGASETAMNKLESTKGREYLDCLSDHQLLTDDATS